MKKLAVIASMVAVLAAFGSSQAAVQMIVSTPGGAVTSLYETPVSVAVTATPVVYANIDPLANHNVVSDAKKVPSCQVNCAPLFRSGNPIPAGGTATIDLAGIAPGDYGFHCSLHPNMKGTLTIVA